MSGWGMQQTSGGYRTLTKWWVGLQLCAGDIPNGISNVLVLNTGSNEGKPRVQSNATVRLALGLTANPNAAIGAFRTNSAVQYRPNWFAPLVPTNANISFACTTAARVHRPRSHSG